MAQSSVVELSTGGAPRAGRKRSEDARQAWWGYIFVAPFFILFAIFGLYPLIFSFALSFTGWKGTGPIIFTGIGNYKLLVQDQVFWRAMTNGVILFALYVPAMTLLALVLASVLNSKRILGFRFFRTLIFMPYITNMVAAGFVFQLLFNTQYGTMNSLIGAFGIAPIPWLDTVWGARITLALLVTWAWLGYNMVIMQAGLQTIPNEVNEAARIDGANQMQIFFRITIPLMRPVLLFVIVLSTAGTFNLFTEPVSLFTSNFGSGPLNSTITPAIHIFNQAFRNFRFGYASAVAYVFFAFVFVLTILQYRYFGRENN